MKLLPCPFCGGRAVIRRKAIRRDFVAVIAGCSRVRCPIQPETTPCDAKGRMRGRDGAAEAWNNRPTNNP